MRYRDSGFGTSPLLSRRGVSDTAEHFINEPRQTPWICYEIHYPL